MTHPTTEPGSAEALRHMAEELERLVERPGVRDLVEALVRDDEATLATQIALTEIPAPPFQEQERAAHLARIFEGAGLDDVGMDHVGNVSGWLPGSEDVAPLVVSAHLDTVFPPDTEVTVTRNGDLLRGPGISDDGRGLAALVALARVLASGPVRTRTPLRFVGTVGEEGAGDLRGVKALFPAGAPAASAASAFISLDGAGMARVVSRGLGSRRFRITLGGPGGHSWVDWGTVNPAHALMSLGSALTTLALPAEPKTTLTIARLGGGKSINAIPQEAWLEIDCRSAGGDALEGLVTAVEGVVRDGEVRHPGIRYALEVIGNRPGGSTDEGHRLVQASLAATRLVGEEPQLALSSTDANVPMALGIPAVTLGCGGEAGKAHTTDEWYRNTNGPDGIVRALHVILLVAGLADEEG